MINLRDELKNFAPVDLESILKINPDISEDYKTSVDLYNSALENLRFNSEDIAIIELKKAVALNPEFNEAVMLLGVCFCYMKAYEKAEEMFKRVVKAESNGVKAFNYLNRIRNNHTEQSKSGDEDQESKERKSTKHSKSISKTSASRSAKRTSKDASYAISQNVSYSMPEVSLRANAKASRKDTIIRYITGVITGLIIAFIVGVPSIFGTKRENKPQEDANTDMIVTLNEKIEDYENRNNMLSQEINNLKKDLENAQKDAEYYKSAVKLTEAEELLKNNMYEEAADVLVAVKNIEFISEEKEKYDELVNKTMQVATDRVYSQAYNFFQSGNYQQALEKYLKIPDYMENYSKMDIVLYYIGKTYLALNDNENAKLAFQEVIERFPESEYAKYSENRLGGINAN
ncbi:MAG: tetratricopeptide repeat protein [Clostridiaceae bacterium]|nr:tetratricopeptide repeat protein [Clostridiaceae bacterium]